MKNIDRDFFRGMVREKADSMAPVVSLRHAVNAIAIAHNALLFMGDADDEARRPSETIDAMAQISALCERAAVDVILPQCSTRNKVSALTNSTRKEKS
jgi:hypothetical protein